MLAVAGGGAQPTPCPWVEAPEPPSAGLSGASLAVVVQATWLAYDMVVTRTNPTLAESMRRLEDAFLNCKEEMEKNWQELLSETKRTQ